MVRKGSASTSFGFAQALPFPLVESGLTRWLLRQYSASGCSESMSSAKNTDSSTPIARRPLEGPCRRVYKGVVYPRPRLSL